MVDQPFTVGTLTIAVTHDEGILVGYLSGWRFGGSRTCIAARQMPMPATIIVTAARLVPHALRSLRLADDLPGQVTATSNRMGALLIQTAPARVIGPRLDHPATLDVLQRHPSPAALRSAGEK